MVVQFRAVEGAVTFVDHIRNSLSFDSFAQGIRGLFPNSVITHCIIRFCRQFYMVFEAELAINTVEEFDNLQEFILHLFWQHEYVSIILRESTNPKEAMEGTRQFMAVNQAQFCITKWEITVGMHFILVNQNATWAVHRLNCIFLIINDCSVHVFTVVIPVTGSFPQLFVENNWCANFIIIKIMMYFAPEVFQSIAHSHSFWQEEWEARTFFFKDEEA